MSLPAMIAVGYVIALSLALLLTVSLARVAKEADEREAKLQRAEARRRARRAQRQ